MEAVNQESGPCFIGSKELAAFAKKKFCCEYGQPWMLPHALLENWRLLLQHKRQKMKLIAAAAQTRKVLAKKQGTDVNRVKELKHMRNGFIRKYQELDPVLEQLERLIYTLFVASVTLLVRDFLYFKIV